MLSQLLNVSILIKCILRLENYLRAIGSYFKKTTTERILNEWFDSLSNQILMQFNDIYRLMLLLYQNIFLFYEVCFGLLSLLGLLSYWFIELIEFIRLLVY